MERKLREASFTLDDYLAQFESIKKMGSMKDLIGMLPGMGNLKISDKDIDEAKIEKFKAIIRSMTPAEREKPDIINSSRKKRIANGAGTTVEEVNKLLKQYDQTNKLMKQMTSGKKFGKFGKLPF